MTSLGQLNPHPKRSKSSRIMEAARLVTSPYFVVSITKRKDVPWSKPLCADRVFASAVCPHDRVPPSGLERPRPYPCPNNQRGGSREPLPTATGGAAQNRYRV